MGASSGLSPVPDGRVAPPGGEVVLRRRRQWWLATLCAVVGLGQVDLATVEVLPTALRVANGTMAMVALALFVRVVWPPVAMRVAPAGVEVGRLLRPPQRRRWDELGEARVVVTGVGRRLTLRRAGRRRVVGVVREDAVVGSMDELVAELVRGGVPVAAGGRRRTPRWALAAVRGTRRLAGGLILVFFVVHLPVPGRYASLPGDVRPAAQALVPRGADRGGVHLVTTRAEPVNALTLLAARGDRAVRIGSRSEILGPAPNAVLEELERQLTGTAAKEAVVAAWRHAGVPVALEGAGIELVTVPPPLRGTLRPEDVVEAVAGRPTTTLGAFWAAAEATRRQPVRLSLRREGGRREVTVPAGWIYSAPGKFFVAPAEVEVTGAPRPLEVDHHGLSGPSAGLAWALAALERIEGRRLVEGDHLVAATGAVSGDGAVHDVGGVAQKAAAVARAGLKVFLVPEALAPVARHHAGAGVRVVGVATLAEAVAALTEHAPTTPR